MKFFIPDKKAFETDIAAQKIVQFINKVIGEKQDCIWYYRYPLYLSENGFVPTIVLIDRDYGVIIFKAYDFSNEQKINLSENYWIVNGERRKNDLLAFEEYCYSLKKDVERPKYRLLNKIRVHSFLCFPFLDETLQTKDIDHSFDRILFSNFESKGVFEKIAKQPLTDTEWLKLRNIIQNLEPLTKNIGIQVNEPPKNIGEAIITNEKKICVFDDGQQLAAIKVPYGGARIRGLAGTGKTIILTWKAANIHFMYPNAKILYTFYTKSLYPYIQKLILSFYRKQSNDEPNWDNLNILHAWGGKNQAGVYFNACKENNVPFKSVSDLKFFENPLGTGCSELINNKLSEKYDFVLIDEAQDMPFEFFKLIEKITKSPKNIVIAYDELQNTENTVVPDFGKLFGVDKFGKPLVPLKKEDDIILKTSYRNHMKVLHLAFAIGFGLYSEQGLVQIIDRKENWTSIGYTVKSGTLEAGSLVSVERPSANSPNNIEEIYNKIESVTFERFDTNLQELEFVSKKIIWLIKHEEVRPEDIVVINLDNKTIKNDYLYIKGKLFLEGINSKTPGIIDDSDDFFIDGNVTLSSTRRAKGNESPIIFVMGINKICEPSTKVQSRLIRSFAFVSITRAKAWCFISGHGNYANKFLKEYQNIMKDYPVLKFKFPTEKEREEMRQIDYITKDEASKQEYFNTIELAKKIIDSNEMYVQNIPEDIKKRLKEILNR